MTEPLNDYTKIVRTIIEMFRDRNYTFHHLFDPNKFLETISDQSAASVPFINQKVTNTSLLPLNGKGTPIYVYIQEGDENTYTFSDNQPDKLALTKQISYLLKESYPELSGAKKLTELYENLHLMVVLNVVKRDLIKFEEESLHIYNLEVWPKFRLRFNISKHVLVPQHTKLSPEENKAYKDKFQTIAATENLIRIDDPIIRYYYGQAGEIYHIKRHRADECYRLVISKTIHSQNKKK